MHGQVLARVHGPMHAPHVGPRSGTDRFALQVGPPEGQYCHVHLWFISYKKAYARSRWCLCTRVLQGLSAGLTAEHRVWRHSMKTISSALELVVIMEIWHVHSTPMPTGSSLALDFPKNCKYTATRYIEDCQIVLKLFTPQTTSIKPVRMQVERKPSVRSIESR